MVYPIFMIMAYCFILHRMDSNITETSYIGEIHLSTQLLEGDLGAAEEETRLSKLQARNSSLSKSLASHQSMDILTSNAKFTLFRNSPLSTWWPIKTLAPLPLNTVAGNLSGKLRYGDELDGFFLAGPDQITIYVPPTSTGFLMQCKVDKEPFIKVPWDKVRSFDCILVFLHGF